MTIELFSRPVFLKAATLIHLVSHWSQVLHMFLDRGLQKIFLWYYNELCRSTILQSTRGPFSVTEVETLVEAVEKLGTGRWRNVKMRAFEDADHRTYVDLKDKWKTLVHTASIAPQQRRGEHVPRELLDRVLAANAYWSKHQPKHRKHKVEPLQITNSPVEMVGA